MAAICSVMTYGSEAWLLNTETRRALNGASSKMVSAITGRTVHEEAKSEGKTYDVVAGIRATRMRWLGQILRMDDGRMVLQAVKMMYDNRREGDLLMDAPVTSDWDELRSMASAEKGKTWQQLVRQIKDVVSIQATKSGSKKGGGKKRKSSKKRNGKQKKKKVSDGEKEGKERGDAGRRGSGKRR